MKPDYPSIQHKGYACFSVEVFLYLNLNRTICKHFFVWKNEEDEVVFDSIDYNLDTSSLINLIETYIRTNKINKWKGDLNV